MVAAVRLHEDTFGWVATRKRGVRIKKRTVANLAIAIDNLAIVIDSARAVKFHNAANSIVRFQGIFFLL
jgi:hypothetical protein